ncbi:molybdenum cofactor guanylyltransferase MobA [Aquisalimonas asiatica]|uniref:Molybdenum cofactor guanylyltransferase n=1 Tax=Aquisalimonas asiatica TaxID=406100 RepID=A0A1H8RKT6_9GAMM|nr:molybdenum cofactor guanylyltransferase MobA [Aquisalimonas asiatica]SEO67169.1 molybdenum cofactor guanylyltransferase [Aquisalimonas asiatica]
MTRPETNTVTGVVLAGGRATRMNGTDKGLIEVAGEPMVDHVIRRLRPQVATLVINANRSHAIYAARGWPVVADGFGEFAGPLAGMAAGLGAAETDWVVTVPCDSPLVPAELVTRLGQAVIDTGADAAVATGAGRMQPVFAMLPRRLLPDLESFLGEGGRKIDRWYAQHAVAEVAFDDCDGAFLNVNTPEDRDRLEARLEGRTQSTADP